MARKYKPRLFGLQARQISTIPRGAAHQRGPALLKPAIHIPRCQSAKQDGIARGNSRMAPVTERCGISQIGLGVDALRALAHFEMQIGRATRSNRSKALATLNFFALGQFHIRHI